MLPAGITEYDDVGQEQRGIPCACRERSAAAWVRADSLYHAATGNAGARHAHAGHAADAGDPDDADDVAHRNLASPQWRRKRLRIDFAYVCRQWSHAREGGM